MFTDAIRSEVDNYNSDQYLQYVASTQFNYYDDFKLELEFTSGNIVTGITKYTRVFDLYIDGDESQGFDAVKELSYVFEYIDKSGISLDGKSFCVMLGEDMSADNIREALRSYVNRVGGNKAKIDGYNLIVDQNDIIDTQKRIYKAGAVITIVLSLPKASSNTPSQNAA